MTTVMALLILTMLALAMYRGFGLQQKIAGNTREKEKAFQAAQNALEFAEAGVLLQGKTAGITASPCGSADKVDALDKVRVCDVALVKPADPDNWIGFSSYKPPAMTVSTGNTTFTDELGRLDTSYFKNPQLYVRILYGNTDPNTIMYEVTASANGGTNDTTAVVKSVYSVAAALAPIDKDPSTSK